MEATFDTFLVWGLLLFGLAKLGMYLDPRARAARDAARFAPLTRTPAEGDDE